MQKSLREADAWRIQLQEVQPGVSGTLKTRWPSRRDETENKSRGGN